MALPCRWRDGGLGDFAGRVRFRRRFGYPGRIDPFERVWLTFEGVEEEAHVSLNGRALGRHRNADGPFAFDVTGLLRQRNELVVVVDGGADGGIWGEVALEVRRTAFLRGLRASLPRAAAPTALHVAGEVVGTSDRPLDLYVLGAGRTLVQATVEPGPEGRAFQLTAETLADVAGATDISDLSNVRVELVDGAVVWYGVDVRVQR